MAKAEEIAKIKRYTFKMNNPPIQIMKKQQVPEIGQTPNG